MEEWVGEIWHKFITRKASSEYQEARVKFADIRQSVALVFRALGGEGVKRVEAATGRDYLVRRSFLEKISGANQQISLAWQDDESLRLPESLAVFPDASLNRDLYIWLAVLAAQHNGRFKHWGLDNQQLVLDVLAKYPGLTFRYQRLAKAFVGLRGDPARLPREAREMELAINQALLEPGSVKVFPVVNYAPKAVLLWLYPAAVVSSQASPFLAGEDGKNEQESNKQKQKKQISTRKKAERTDAGNNRDGMMIFRLESLFSWSEFSKMDRGLDDTDDEDNDRVAEDLDKITLSQQQTQKSSAIKMDLDLPSASEDDIPLGPGCKLPEWDYRSNQLVPDRCLLHPMLPRDAVPKGVPAHLQHTAKTIQAQFEQLQSVRYWLKSQPQGEEIDMNAWLDFYVESQASTAEDRGLYQSFRGNFRDLSCLLLADLSMSTEAYLDDDNRVIDVVKDSLLLFGEALQSSGDNFAMYGFSSVKRSNVRFSVLKNFRESYGNQVRGRIQALKPGFYTRMGAAVRQATKLLIEQQSTQKLLLMLTDGKPNDIDHYEGRFGIEDCRQAILEARQQGIKPFCITIDQDAADYLPYIFGSSGFTVIMKPSQLPVRLPQLYHQLTAQ
ncbi:nitric oxide reductase activation protein NorD [Thalassomonas haliotis]|uniref:VWA domain-containing protein n=1 Tax=Thalassomonas haliotis TaxID=485448 RepID=A0ABY7VLL8_9GAMM|nr:VWA domain-containing protein [Thalassomonas haliotis]WDE14092.1 VWA domain-containing protein [Thalassomonas haliotis]